jgi:hypothetical protein
VRVTIAPVIGVGLADNHARNGWWETKRGVVLMVRLVRGARQTMAD